METETRTGIYAAFGFHVSFEERLDHITNAGFHATSLWWEHRNPRIRELKHAAPQMVRDRGLHLESIHVPYAVCNDLWWGSDEVRENSIALHMQWIDDCHHHAIPIMVMHVTLGKEPPPVSDTGLDSFGYLIEHAANAGVCIAIENTRVNTHIDALLEAFDSPTLGFCYDISHDVLYSEEPGALLERHASRLVSTHLADTDGILDRHWLPGAGCIDYSTILRSFPANDYAGTFMLEVSSGRGPCDVGEFVTSARTALHTEILERIRPDGA